jgi:hypothetical protein
MVSTSLQTKVPSSTISIALITVTGERHLVRVEREQVSPDHIADGDAFDIPEKSLQALLWNRWQIDWGLRPPDPSRIELINFGQTISNITPLRCNLNGSTLTLHWLMVLCGAGT